MHYFGRHATQNFPFSTRERLTPSKKLSACGAFMMARLRSRLAHIKGAGPLASYRGRDIVRIKGSGERYVQETSVFIGCRRRCGGWVAGIVWRGRFIACFFTRPL